MSIINPTLCNPQDVNNQKAPTDGAKALPIRLDFTGTDPVNGVTSPALFDYSNEQQRGLFSMCQGLYVDNAANGSALKITVNTGGQQIVCPANAQGYFPILCPNPIMLTFTTAGNVLCTVYLLNFPVAPAVWKV